MILLHVQIQLFPVLTLLEVVAGNGCCRELSIERSIKETNKYLDSMSLLLYWELFSFINPLPQYFIKITSFEFWLLLLFMYLLYLSSCVDLSAGSGPWFTYLNNIIMKDVIWVKMWCCQCWIICKQHNFRAPPEHFRKGIGSIQLMKRPPHRQTKQKVTIYPNVLVHCWWIFLASA